jgi:hypothetical protein
LPFAASCPLLRFAIRAPRARRRRRNRMMSARRWAWVVLLLPAAMLLTGAMAAETTVRFSLDFKFEGPSAPFLLAQDKG